jgi:hypothetical protein
LHARRLICLNSHRNKETWQWGCWRPTSPAAKLRVEWVFNNWPSLSDGGAEIPQRRGGSGAREAPADEDQSVSNGPFTAATVHKIDANFPATSRTARSRLVEANLRPRRATVKEVLTSMHRESQLFYANAHANRDDEFWRREV